jgi:hypothetical protein
VLTLSLVGADFGGPHRSVWGVWFAPGDGLWMRAPGGARHSFAPALEDRLHGAMRRAVCAGPIT